MSESLGLLRKRRHLQHNAAGDGAASGTSQSRARCCYPAQIVTTANPGCALQMRLHLRDRNCSMPVKHVIELLDESYANYSEATSRSRSLSAASIEA